MSSRPPTEFERALSEADRPVYEAAGVRLAEIELIEHANQGDEHSAGRIPEEPVTRDEERATDDEYEEVDEESNRDA